MHNRFRLFFLICSPSLQIFNTAFHYRSGKRYGKGVKPQVGFEERSEYEPSHLKALYVNTQTYAN